MSCSTSSRRRSSAPRNSSRCRSMPAVMRESFFSSRGRAGVPGMRELLGEHRLRFAGELLDRAVELAAEPPGRVLARRLDRGSNWTEAASAKRSDARVDHALELLDLASLDVRERGLDAARRLALLARDPLAEGLLALGERLRDLAQRAPAFGRMSVELAGDRRDRLGHGLLEVGAEPRDQGALLVARRGEALALGREPRVQLRDQLPLALPEPRHLRGQRGLRPVEVVPPVADPLLDLALDGGEHLGELRARLALALDRRGLGGRPRSASPPRPGPRANRRARGSAAARAPSPGARLRRRPARRAGPGPRRASGRRSRARSVPLRSAIQPTTARTSRAEEDRAGDSELHRGRMVLRRGWRARLPPGTSSPAPARAGPARAPAGACPAAISSTVPSRVDDRSVDGGRRAGARSAPAWRGGAGRG